MAPLGIVVNPFSGRDVRRVAARASRSDHQEKQQQVTRLILGALSQGVEEIYLAQDPFRINERAVANLPARSKTQLLKLPLSHSAEDTSRMASRFWEAGCRVFIVLGGDGTSRIVARTLPDATLLPLSTGTNNVFPYRLEASVAGIAAGLVAAGKLSADEQCLRCKRVKVTAGSVADLALIDAVLLREDFLGSLLPFEAGKIGALLLTRAEPASIGVSPIGGYLLPCGHEDDFGVLVTCDAEAQRRLTVPISPGLHETLGIAGVEKVSLGAKVTMRGPGLLAFDGDRSLALAEGEAASLEVVRDGPLIIEAEKVLRVAAERGLL